MFIITIISYYHEKGCPDFTDLLMGSMQILQMKITKHTVMFSEWFLTETKQMLLGEMLAIICKYQA